MGCCLCHPIPDSGSLAATRLVARAGAILAWIQPTQHFGLSLAVTEPRLRLSVPEPRQMLGYMCLRWPSPRGFPGQRGSLRQRWLEEIPSPSQGGCCLPRRERPGLRSLAQHPFLGKHSQERPLPWPKALRP